MKKILLTLTVGLFVTASLSAQPAIELSEVSFNFGKTAQHTKVSHTFWIKSVGTENLVISKVIPGCGCTQAPLLDSTLAPGDSTKLEITFASKSYRGHVAKKPYLETNISDEKVYLRIDTEIFPDPNTIEPVSFKPFKLDVSQFSEKPRRKAKFFIENKSDRDYEITLIDGANKPFEIKLPKKVKAGESVEGMITVLKEMVSSEFEQSFTIEINDDSHTRISLPVKRTFRILKKDKK